MSPPFRIEKGIEYIIYGVKMKISAPSREKEARTPETLEISRVSIDLCSEFCYNIFAENITKGGAVMANIVSQVSFFDYTEEVEKLGDLERLQIALEGIDDEALMSVLEKERGSGRDDYPIRVMWNLKIAKKVFEHPKVSTFRRELKRNSQLRRICGLNDNDNKKHLVPPARVFTNFDTMLERHQEMVDAIFDGQVDFFYEEVEGFGEDAACDGKYLDSYANNKPKEGREETDNRTENDAEYSIKEYHYVDKDGKKQTKKETHFGFKAHIICDTKTELPIAKKVTKANYDEKKAAKDLLEDMDAARIEVMKTICMDRGYDSLDMIRLIKEKDIIPLIDIRNMWKDGEGTRQYKDTNMVYNAYGEVFHYDYVEVTDVESSKKSLEWQPVKMKYEGYDKQKKCLRYSHKGKIRKIYISYDERVFLPIARDSEKFKKLYNGRTSVERLNGRLDRDYMFENHTIRGLDKMNLELTISMIVMNGMAVGKIKRNMQSIRSLVKIA